MKKAGRAILLATLMILSIGISIMTIGVPAPPKPQTPPSISYVGVVNNGDGTYTFTYYVTSGDPVVKKWQLHSPCFKQGADISAEAWDSTEGTFTPDWNLNPGQNYIEFKHESKQPFTDGMTRTYEITINIGSYGGIQTGPVDYMLHWPPGTQVDGTITGPICPPDFVIPETPLGVIGPLTSLLAAAGLLAAFKKNLISIKIS